MCCDWIFRNCDNCIYDRLLGFYGSFDLVSYCDFGDL
jgi:hypothetical protein